MHSGSDETFSSTQTYFRAIESRSILHWLFNFTDCRQVSCVQAPCLRYDSTEKGRKTFIAVKVAKYYWLLYFTTLLSFTSSFDFFFIPSTQYLFPLDYVRIEFSKIWLPYRLVPSCHSDVSWYFSHPNKLWCSIGTPPWLPNGLVVEFELWLFIFLSFRPHWKHVNQNKVESFI